MIAELVATASAPRRTHYAAIFQSVAYILGAVGLFYAGRQVRETRRNGTVAAAALFTERWDSPLMQRAREEANKHLPEELCQLYTDGHTVERTPATAEFLLFQHELNFFEDLGTLVKLDAVDLRWIRESLRRTVLDRWELWEPTIRYVQATRGRTTYANFELLKKRLEKPQ